MEMFTHLAKTLVVLVFKFTSKPRNVFLSMLARVCPAANRLTVISQTRTEKEKGKCRRGRGGREGEEGKGSRSAAGDGGGRKLRAPD